MYAANPYIRNLGCIDGLGDFWDSADVSGGSDMQSAVDAGASAASAAAAAIQSPLDVSTILAPTTSSPSSSAWSLDSILGDFGKAASAAASIYQQKQVMDINADRLKRGLAPISASAIAPQVNVGLSPQTQQLVLYGGLALVAVLMFSDQRR